MEKPRRVRALHAPLSFKVQRSNFIEADLAPVPAGAILGPVNS